MAAVVVNRVLQITLAHWQMSHTHTKPPHGSHACKLVTLALTRISISKGECWHYSFIMILINQALLLAQIVYVTGTDCLCDQPIGHIPKAANRHQSNCKVSAAWHAPVPPDAEGLLCMLHRGCHSDEHSHEALCLPALIKYANNLC